MDTFLFWLWNSHLLLESLPISSSGHLILLNDAFSRVLKRAPRVIPSQVMFLMHIPTAFIVSIFLLVHGLFTRPDFFQFIAAACVADTVTGSFYLLAKKTGYPHFPLYAGFLCTACFLLVLPSYGTATSITFSQALIIGCAQSLALLPGISRLAITISVAFWLGCEPLTALLFSLTCELGLLCTAFARAYLGPHTGLFKLSRKQYAILALSTLAAYGLLELVRILLLTNRVYIFGWYMLALAIVVWLAQTLKQRS